VRRDRQGVGCVGDGIAVVRHITSVADDLTSLDKHAACLLNALRVSWLRDEMREVECVVSALQ